MIGNKHAAKLATIKDAVDNFFAYEHGSDAEAVLTKIDRIIRGDAAMSSPSVTQTEESSAAEDTKRLLIAVLVELELLDTSYALTLLLEHWPGQSLPPRNLCPSEPAGREAETSAVEK
jgi:hypothetical protein